MEELITAQDFARGLGIKTDTVKKWRRLGKGPRGHFHLSKTCVVYPIAEVRLWIEAQKRAPIARTIAPGSRACFFGESPADGSPQP
jgi:hypothetical protein